MDISRGARIVLEDCLAARPGERLLVVTDTGKRAIGEALFEAGRGLRLEAAIIVTEPTAVSGAEPAAAVAAAMKASDIVVCPTTHSITHTVARKAACEAGARVATMPGITEEMFVRGAITADYRQVAALSDRIAAILTEGRTARIEKDGRVLELSLAGRRGISSNGLYHRKGESGNLPTGEGYIAPVEGVGEGQLLIDGSLGELGRLRGPLEVWIEGGRAVRFEGPDADWLEARLSVKPEARCIGELGIGTNDKAILSGNLLEDEKVYGTVHVAFGSNATFGGTVSAGVHIDGVMLNAVLSVDGRVLVRDGRLVT
jgi:leucyl aminopeptidase (aminopeptidase T)